MFLWQNCSREEVKSGYIAIFFLKRVLAKGMLQAMDTWEEKNPYSQFKLVIEVKAIFNKNHLHMQHPGQEEPTKRVMFIHRILNKIIQSLPTQEDYEHLGSLFSAVEWQLLDENHTRDSTHVVDNILEFWVYIYRTQMFWAGG